MYLRSGKEERIDLATTNIGGVIIFSSLSRLIRFVTKLVKYISNILHPSELPIKDGSETNDINLNCKKMKYI